MISRRVSYYYQYILRHDATVVRVLKKFVFNYPFSVLQISEWSLFPAQTIQNVVRILARGGIGLNSKVA